MKSFLLVLLAVVALFVAFEPQDAQAQFLLPGRQFAFNVGARNGGSAFNPFLLPGRRLAFRLGQQQAFNNAVVVANQRQVFVQAPGVNVQVNPFGFRQQAFVANPRVAFNRNFAFGQPVFVGNGFGYGGVNLGFNRFGGLCH